MPPTHGGPPPIIGPSIDGLAVGGAQVPAQRPRRHHVLTSTNSRHSNLSALLPSLSFSFRFPQHKATAQLPTRPNPPAPVAARWALAVPSPHPNRPTRSPNRWTPVMCACLCARRAIPPSSSPPLSLPVRAGGLTSLELTPAGSRQRLARDPAPPPCPAAPRARAPPVTRDLASPTPGFDPIQRPAPRLPFQISPPDP